MKELYSTYTDEDLILLIRKKNYGEIRVVKEVDFKVTNDLYKEYVILSYCRKFEILNNGLRHIYQTNLKDDFSNLKVIYNNKEELEEIYIIENEIKIPFYKKYNLNSLKEDTGLLIDECCEYFTNELTDKFKHIKICILGVTFFYDGEAILMNLEVGTNKERENLIINGEDTSHLGNYTNKVGLNKELANKLETLILSIRKDELTDEWELFKYIVNEVYTKLQSVNWKQKIKTTEDFLFISLEQYD